MPRLDDDIADVRQSILQAQANLEYLKEDSDQLTQDAQIMKDDITALQETNVEGALNLTKEARERSQKAAQQVEQIQGGNGPLEESRKNRERTNNLMKNAGVSYKQTQDEDQQTLRDVAQKIRDLEYEIPGLNKKGDFILIVICCFLCKTNRLHSQKITHHIFFSL